MYFWAILRVAVFSYPVGGQVFPKTKGQNRFGTSSHFCTLFHIWGNPLLCEAADLLEVREKLKGNCRAKSFRHFFTLLHTFPHFFTSFQNFSPTTFLKLSLFLLENKKKKTKPFCTSVVARLSSSNRSPATPKQLKSSSKVTKK